MPAVTVAGAGAAVGALAAAPTLVGAAAAAGPPALPLAAVGAAGLAGALLGPLLEAPPHAGSSRPLASARPTGQCLVDELERATGITPGADRPRRLRRHCIRHQCPAAGTPLCPAPLRRPGRRRNHRPCTFPSRLLGKGGEGDHYRALTSQANRYS